MRSSSTLNTIYGVPASRSLTWAEGAGGSMRVLSFRHEQHAGNAAAIAAS